MIMKGQKRKLPPEDLEASDRTGGVAWESQRQFVFYTSLSKYQRGQALPEPSLRRSVLIANTLRQVSLEAASKAPDVIMEASASPCSPASTPQAKERESVFSSTAAPNRHSAVMVANGQLAAASCPSASTGAPSSSSTSCLSFTSNVPLCVEDEDWGSMSADPDFSLSAAISSILTALDTTDGTLQAAPRTPLRSLENLSGPSGAPEGDVAWTKQGVRGHGGLERQEECRAAEGSVEVMRSSYLGDMAVEDLFQDIDTSLLDRDMGALGVRGGAGMHPAGEDLLRYLPPFSSSSYFSSHPFSLSLNQNLKCLPSFSSFSPSAPSALSSPSSSSSSPFSAQNHMRDGIELEHLMEILVEA